MRTIERPGKINVKFNIGNMSLVRKQFWRLEKELITMSCMLEVFNRIVCMEISAQKEISLQIM